MICLNLSAHRFLTISTMILASLAAVSASRPGLAAPIRVEAQEVEVSAVEKRIEAIGSLRSDESVIIRPEIDGRIARIHFSEGQPVSEGDLLISLDDSIIAAELAEAAARLTLSEANAKRARELAQKGSGTRRALDEAEATLAIDRARVQLARARLEKSQIRAPFSGQLGLRHVSVGDYVKAGDNIVNLEAIDPLKVDFRVPEIFLGQVREGQEIRLKVDAFPTRSFVGQVYAIDPLIDESGRSIVIRATVPNENRILRPGLFVRVTLIAAQRMNAVLVPEESLAPQDRQQYVFRVVDGKAVRTAVKIGVRRNAMVEITEGLKAGDIVITAGQIKVRDGSEVEIVEPAESTIES